MQASSFFIGPHKTPNSVKWLILVTVLASILSPVFTYFFIHYFQFPGPSAWFALSLFGLQQGWLWEPLTYFFLQSAGVGISVSLLISLFFHMFLLWFSGSEIDFRFGTKTFIGFYLSAGMAAGIVSSVFLFLFSSQAVIATSTPPVYALLIVWAMLYPELDLFFFFLIRFKAKWLVALFLGFALIIHLSYGQFILLIADLTGILWGFCAGRFIWKLPNPYPLNLDLPSKKKKKAGGKIIDISAFKEDDDAFMDRMLAKISKHGEESLSSRERQRMEEISKKRSR